MFKKMKKIYLTIFIIFGFTITSCGVGSKKPHLTWVDFKNIALKESIKNIATNKNHYSEWKTNDDFNKVNFQVDDDKNKIDMKISDDSMFEVADFTIQYYQGMNYNVNLWTNSNLVNNYYSWHLFLNKINNVSIIDLLKTKDNLVWSDPVIAKKLVEAPSDDNNGSNNYRVVIEIQKSANDLKNIRTYYINWDQTKAYNIINWQKYSWTEYIKDASFVSPQNLLNFCNPQGWYQDIEKLKIENIQVDNINHNIVLGLLNQKKQTLTFTSAAFNPQIPTPYYLANSDQWSCNNWIIFLNNSKGLAIKNDLTFKKNIISYLIGVYSSGMRGWDSSMAEVVSISNIKTGLKPNPYLSLTFNNTKSTAVAHTTLYLLYVWDGIPYNSDGGWKLNV